MLLRSAPIHHILRPKVKPWQDLLLQGHIFGLLGCFSMPPRREAPSKPSPGAGPYFSATSCPTTESSQGPGPPPARPVLSSGSRNWLASPEMPNVGLDRQVNETNIAYFLLKRAFWLCGRPAWAETTCALWENTHNRKALGLSRACGAGEEQDLTEFLFLPQEGEGRWQGQHRNLPMPYTRRLSPNSYPGEDPDPWHGLAEA